MADALAWNLAERSRELIARQQEDVRLDIQCGCQSKEDLERDVLAASING